MQILALNFQICEILGIEGGYDKSDSSSPEQEKNDLGDSIEVLHDQCHLVTTTEHRLY